MWGNISLESTFQTNFNVGFSNTSSDILIHLSLWQYWWWFWFAFVWSLYFLILIRVLKYRTLKFKPRLMTSMRPHGKWGDLIICCIPVTWCINILINSNFLLKMIEWQSENSLFTIRIRGRQWYWVYKFDLKDFTDILSANKNVGHNKIFFSSFGELKIMDNYLHNVNLRASNKFLNKYWNIQLYKYGKNDNYFINSFVDNKFLFNINKINNSQKIFSTPKVHTSADYKFLYEDSRPFVFKRKNLFKMFLNMVKPKVSDNYVKIYLKSIIELDLNKSLNYMFNFNKQFKINLSKFNDYSTKINYFNKAFFTKYNIFPIDKNYLMSFYEPLDIFAEKKKYKIILLYLIFLMNL